MTIRDPYALIANALRATRRPGVRSSSHGPRDVFCYAALGDSFTAGRGCRPGESWADRLATALGAAHSPLGYFNLATDGATSADVLSHQVGPALQLEPDLVTVICGANDVLETVRPDVDGYAERLGEIFDRLREGLPHVAVLTATTPENWRFLDLRPRTRQRVVSGIQAINGATRTVARQRGVPCLDVVGHPGLDDPRNFCDDGLHPSPAGHERAAVELGRALRSQFGINRATAPEEKEVR